MGKIIPFPLRHRVALVQRIARRSMDFDLTGGEKHIRQQIELQAKVMRRKGVAEETINREICALERAIRAALWTAIFDRPRGAK